MEKTRYCRECGQEFVLTWEWTDTAEVPVWRLPDGENPDMTCPGCGQTLSLENTY
jgi:hypothetical protein